MADSLMSMPTPEELVEILWRWQAPRRRMAKLLWHLLQGNDDPEHLERCFMADLDDLAQAVVDCAKSLRPMQERLLWVLEGFTERKRVDAFLGQGDWGEEWWLPPEQADYVRQQLQRAYPDLLQRSSDYGDALHYTSLPYFEVASDDEERAYAGVHETCGPRVYVEDGSGKRFPLSHADFPFRWPPGTQFGWGYGGYGPGMLALSILADATGGDLEIAKKLQDHFVETVLCRESWEKCFRLPRRAVLAWLEDQGVSRRDIVQAVERVRKLKTQLQPAVEELKKRLAAIEQLGGLIAQRFDIVPPDFECALYVDLIRMFERGGWVLRCSRCKLPIPCDKSPRGNRQRARWIAERPVYHADCFRARALERKRDYWARRTQSGSFREAERRRAREKRKRSAVPARVGTSV